MKLIHVIKFLQKVSALFILIFSFVVHAGPTDDIIVTGCGSCFDDSWLTQHYLNELNRAAAHAEAQRAMAAERERLRRINEAQYNTRDERVRQCMNDALNNHRSCTASADRELRSHNGTCHWMAAGGVASATIGAIIAVPSFGWGLAIGTAGAGSFGAAATMCYVNADGVHGEELRQCDFRRSSQELNSCGRIQ